MSTRRGVPAGVQFITGVGGFAAGLVSLTALLGIYVAVQQGDLGLAARFVPMLGLGVGHVVSLYGLVRLRRRGYRWTRRLFAATLLVNLPGLQTGDPLTLGTVVFSVFVLGYLWLADAKTFRPSAGGSSPTDSDAKPAEIAPEDPHDRSEEPIRIEGVDADDGDAAESDSPEDPLAGGSTSTDDGSDTDADGEGDPTADGDLSDATGENDRPDDEDDPDAD